MGRKTAGYLRGPATRSSHCAGAEFARLGIEGAEAVVGAVALGAAAEVGHIIAGVVEGGYVAGVQPDRIEAEGVEAGQLLDGTAQVADAFAVGIAEGLRGDLLGCGVFTPGVRGWAAVGVAGDAHGESVEEARHGETGNPNAETHEQQVKPGNWKVEARRVEAGKSHRLRRRVKASRSDLRGAIRGAGTRDRLRLAGIRGVHRGLVPD